MFTPYRGIWSGMGITHDRCKINRDMHRTQVPGFRSIRGKDSPDSVIPLVCAARLRVRVWLR